MKTINHFFHLVIIIVLVSACKKDKDDPGNEVMVDVGTFELFTITGGEGTATVVFEAGLGNNYKVWEQENTLENTAEFAQTLAYNRAGYAPSGIGTEARSIEQIVEELDQVIEERLSTDKIYLVGHSWGGPIIRAYAIAHPEKVNGLLFIDPSHEDFKDIDQSDEDELLALLGNSQGKEEAEQLLEGIQYISTLPDLPNIPVTVLTAMKTTPDFSAEDRQSWYDAHDNLGEGISNFKHIAVEDSDHYIQLEKPTLVMDALQELVVQ